MKRWWLGPAVALAGAGLLGLLHSMADVAPASPGEALGVYAAFAAVCGALGLGLAWASLPPAGEPTASDVVRRQVSNAMRNGLLCGAAYSIARLGLFLGPGPYRLSFIALYAGGVLVLFTLGLAAIGAVIGRIEARRLKSGE